MLDDSLLEGGFIVILDMSLALVSVIANLVIITSIRWPELGNLEYVVDPDRLIWISKVDTFNFLLNSLFFSALRHLNQIPTNESSLIEWREKF